MEMPSKCHHDILVMSYDSLVCGKIADRGFSGKVVKLKCVPQVRFSVENRINKSKLEEKNCVL